ncbi:unnamed protein product [Adineta ricciae]|uniref:Tubby C-terminal domain-containing protein n=1 Tax=Adineta ricciae TaxID=249248 RepID=A0A815DLR7_ADIRI|nr:unnamed protein product [Adineta ricciae]CAF1363444.1 unnamed protein product [Adineta ricciae]
MTELSSQKVENSNNQDLDDDDDEFNSSNKITPNDHQSISDCSNSSSISATKDDFNVENLIQSDLCAFVHTLTPKDYPQLIQCHLKRHKDGLNKSFSLYFTGQDPDDEPLLLTARKHTTLSGHTEFLIGINIDTPAKNLNEENSIAKLRSTKIFGHEYILYDYDKPSTNEPNKPQSLAVVYDEHIFESKDPREITVLLHNTGDTIREFQNNETIIDEWRAGRSNSLLEFKNKYPKFNEESKIYTIGFLNNRVKQPSHKNFQIISSNEQGKEIVILQFGRIDENDFVLDFRYPFTTIDAFAIALSSFHNRIRK